MGFGFVIFALQPLIDLLYTGLKVCLSHAIITLSMYNNAIVKMQTMYSVAVK